MGKRKAEDLVVAFSNGGSKKSKLSNLNDAPAMSKPAKMTLMDDSDSSGSEDSDEDGGAKLLTLLLRKYVIIIDRFFVHAS